MNELLDLVAGSMTETAKNRQRFFKGDEGDNACYLALVSAVFKRLADDPTVPPD